MLRNIAPRRPKSRSASLSMTSELDIYRSAKLYIDQYGDDAAVHAAMRVDALIVEGDVQGVSVWKRVLKAVDELLSVGGETVH